MAFTNKQQRFIEEYTVDFNATQAAIRAGYSEKTAYSIGQENLKKPDIAQAIAERIEAKTLKANELLAMQSEIATLDISKYIRGYGPLAAVDIEALIEDGHGKHIKSVKYTASGATVYEFYDKQRAQEKLLSALEPKLGSNDSPLRIEIVHVDTDIS